jgi:thymidylate synthase ThyX
MGFDAKILADSLSPDGVRLTTFEVTMPRIVLAEFNTHRMFSRNSASSRAIPVEKMIARVMEDPYIPTSWGKNQKGMQAAEELTGAAAEEARSLWLKGRDEAVFRAQSLLSMDIHKQLTNRLLEPFMYHTCLVTATEWSNFFHLRNNAQAHPDIQIPARMMQELYEKNEPEKLNYDEWHLPLIQSDEFVLSDQSPEWNEPIGSACTLLTNAAAIKISAGRCARISYLTHDGKRDHQADIELHDRLLTSGHMSPFEHVATPLDRSNVGHLEMSSVLLNAERKPERWSGNFRGWVQYRKTIPFESDSLGSRA